MRQHLAVGCQLLLYVCKPVYSYSCCCHSILIRCL
jgi:hypothetical protein